MSSKDEKREQIEEFEEFEGEPVEDWTDLPRTGQNVIRRVDPLGMRVLVRIRVDSNRSEAGLYLPEGAKQNSEESLLGEVVEVASAIDEDSDEEANISGIPEGALVLIPSDKGVSVPWDDDLRIIESASVLAIVQEVELN